jgi:hypothetical protein
MNREQVIAAGMAAARAHRRERGLPETITDPAVLSDLASMLRPTVTKRQKTSR